MGKSKYLEKIKELFDKSPVADFKSVEKIVKYNSKRKNNYARLLISNLIKKGYIKKIAKGYYTKYDDNSLIVLCWDFSYLGLQSALSFHNLWEQEAIPVVITAKKVRTGLREVLNANVLIRRINKKFIYGIEYLKEGNFYLPYSDVEKTFIDMIYFNQPLDKNLVQKFRKKIKSTKLKIYLKKYDKKFKRKVLRVYLASN